MAASVNTSIGSSWKVSCEQKEKESNPSQAAVDLFKTMQTFFKENYWLFYQWKDMSDDKRITACVEKLTGGCQTLPDPGIVDNFIKFAVHEVREQANTKVLKGWWKDQKKAVNDFIEHGDLSDLKTSAKENEKWHCLKSTPAPLVGDALVAKIESGDSDCTQVLKQIKENIKTQITAFSASEERVIEYIRTHF